MVLAPILYGVTPLSARRSLGSNKLDLVPRLERLRQVRLRRAMSQRELAKAAELSPDTIRRLEGTAEAQFATMRKLAKALNVEPAELMAPGQTS
jgi:DNA-binding Xre family transcriptional regulator